MFILECILECILEFLNLAKFIISKLFFEVNNSRASNDADTFRWLPHHAAQVEKRCPKASAVYSAVREQYPRG